MWAETSTIAESTVAYLDLDRNDFPRIVCWYCHEVLTGCALDNFEFRNATCGQNEANEYSSLFYLCMSTRQTPGC